VDSGFGGLGFKRASKLSLPNVVKLCAVAVVVVFVINDGVQNQEAPGERSKMSTPGLSNVAVLLEKIHSSMWTLERRQTLESRVITPLREREEQLVKLVCVIEISQLVRRRTAGDATTRKEVFAVEEIDVTLVNDEEFNRRLPVWT
jgi:hypothetical protein